MRKSSVSRYPVVFVAVGKFNQAMYEVAVVARTQPAIGKLGQHLSEFFHGDTKHRLLKQRVEIQLTVEPRKHGNINLDVHSIHVIYLCTETRSKPSVPSLSCRGIQIQAGQISRIEVHAASDNSCVGIQLLAYSW